MPKRLNIYKILIVFYLSIFMFILSSCSQMESGSLEDDDFIVGTTIGSPEKSISVDIPKTIYPLCQDNQTIEELIARQFDDEATVIHINQFNNDNNDEFNPDGSPETTKIIQGIKSGIIYTILEQAKSYSARNVILFEKVLDALEANNIDKFTDKVQVVRMNNLYLLKPPSTTKMDVFDVSSFIEDVETVLNDLGEYIKLYTIRMLFTNIETGEVWGLYRFTIHELYKLVTKGHLVMINPELTDVTQEQSGLRIAATIFQYFYDDHQDETTGESGMENINTLQTIRLEKIESGKSRRTNIKFDLKSKSISDMGYEIMTTDIYDALEHIFNIRGRFESRKGSNSIKFSGINLDRQIEDPTICINYYESGKPIETGCAMDTPPWAKSPYDEDSYDLLKMLTPNDSSSPPANGSIGTLLADGFLKGLTIDIIESLMGTNYYY